VKKMLQPSAGRTDLTRRGKSSFRVAFSSVPVFTVSDCRYCTLPFGTSFSSVPPQTYSGRDEKIRKKNQQDLVVKEVESEAVWKKSGIGRR